MIWIGVWAKLEIGNQAVPASAFLRDSGIYSLWFG